MKALTRIALFALIIIIFNLKQCREYNQLATKMCNCADDLISLSNDSTSFISDFERYELATLRLELPAFDTLDFSEKEQLKDQILYFQNENIATYRAKLENALFPHTFSTRGDAIKLTEIFITRRYLLFGVSNIDQSKVKEGAKVMANYFVCPNEIKPGFFMRFRAKNKSRIKRQIKEKCPDFDTVIYKIY